jgi:hypothetical protein
MSAAEDIKTLPPSEMNELEDVISAFVDPTDPVSDPGDDPMGEPPEIMSEVDRQADIIRLLPMHLTAPKATRGRPREIGKVPTPRDLEYHANMSAAKAVFVDQDPVVQAARGRADAGEVLRLIKSEIAREAAALHFQRIENEKLGKDTSQQSSRRIDALTRVANIELEIKKLGADIIDLHGEKFQRVFHLWIEMLREVAAETMSPEQIDLFFNRLSTAMDGWEDKATDVIR